jgi:hypothetical protein
MDRVFAEKGSKSIDDSVRKIILHNDEGAKIEASAMEQSHRLVTKSIAHVVSAPADYCKKATVRLFCRKEAIFGAGAIAKKQRPL